MKKLQRVWKEEKEVLILLFFVLFLVFGYVRSINTINELRLENQDLWEQIDRYIPNEEENY